MAVFSETAQVRGLALRATAPAPELGLPDSNNYKAMSANQLERIAQMERRLDAIASATANLAEALDQYIALQDDIDQLDRYYGSDEWRGDHDDDSAGRLPHDLKRGVLSEDGAWNTLAEVREVNQRLVDVAKTITER